MLLENKFEEKRITQQISVLVLNIYKYTINVLSL